MTLTIAPTARRRPRRQRQQATGRHRRSRPAAALLAHSLRACRDALAHEQNVLGAEDEVLPA